MTKFRFVGRLEFPGYTIPVDLWFDYSRANIVAALSGLLSHLDDPAPLQSEQRSGLPSPPVGGTGGGGTAAKPRRPITSPHLFQDLVPGDDERNWLIIAERFPFLFPEEQKNSIPGLSKPPTSRADIDKLRRQGGGEVTGEESEFEHDLANLLDIPREELLKSDGTINASEVARRIGRRTGGSDWAYVQELAAHLQAIYDDDDLATLDADWRAA